MCSDETEKTLFMVSLPICVMENQKLFPNTTSEIRKGTIVLALLSW